MVRVCSLLIVALLATGVVAGQNVVVVLDDSGSMGERMRSDRRTIKIEAAKRALITVLETLPDDAKVGVVVLNRGRRDAAWIIPLGPVDKNDARAAVQRIQATGSTPLGHFMKVAADALLELRNREHYGLYRLLIVTDGEANDRDLVERFLPDILSRGITVDVIGVDMARSHSLATKVHTYRRADDPASLTEAISAALAESTSDVGDAGESDFEILEAIPGELAAAALAALATSGNEPIGESPAAAVHESGAAPGMPAAGRAVRAVGFGMGFFCLLAFLFLLAIVVGAALLLRRA